MIRLEKAREDLLNEWENTLLEVDSNMDELNKVIGCSPDYPLWESINKMADRYTDLVSEKVGDEDGLLDWYRFDNEYGCKELKAGKGEELKPVTDVEGLLPLLSELTEKDLSTHEVQEIRKERKELRRQVILLTKEVAALRKQVDAASG